MMNKSLRPTLADLADSLVAEVEFDHHLDLNLAGAQVRVKTNSLMLVTSLQHYFAPFVAQPKSIDFEILAIEGPNLDLDLPFVPWEPEPGKSRVKEEFVDLVGGRVVRKQKTGLVFLFGGGTNIAIGQCKENDNQVINFVNNRFIELLLNKDATLGHAAAVRVNNRGIALAGFSGMGKSTLALHLLSRGADFVSNDRLMVQKVNEGLMMFGVPKLPRINPGTALSNPDLRQILSEEEIERFSQLEPDDLWELEHKYDVYLDRCFSHSRFLLNGWMDALVILNWQRVDRPMEIHEVNLREKPYLLGAFRKDPGAFFLANDPVHPPQFNEERYLKQLESCRVYEITGGVDFEKAALSCLNLTERSKH